MSDASDKQSLLSAFDLGPAWARDDAPAKKYDNHKGEDRDKKRGGRQGGGRGGFDRGNDRGGQRGGGQRGGGQRGGGQRGGGPHRGRDDRQRRDGGRDLPAPAPGVKVNIGPAKEAVHLVVKEIHQVARVYSLFDIAQILLDQRERCRLSIESDEKRGSVMYRGLKDESLFVTKEEAVAHFWQSGPVEELYEVEDTETDPPAGNFQVVAKCGLSGEWLGPPNFHSYQTTLRRLHRERFSNMDFDRYASRVKTERGEEAVNAWLETMKKRRRWRPKGGSDEDWTFDRGVVERDFATKHFGEAYKEVRKTELPGDVPPANLSVGLLASIRIAGSNTRRHPAMLIPTICRFLESEHLAVFKRKGKLYSGPARPHPLPDDIALAERPTKIVEWVDSQEKPMLGDLWKALLPEGSEEAPKEWLVDMFWLLTQGHLLLFADDTLVLPKRRAQTEKAKPAEGGAKKRKRKKRKRKVYKARHRSPAKLVRKITRLKPGGVRALRGKSMLLARRLEREGRIESLVEE
ncbi:hypothetical protein [Haloferula sp.]|uniref:hypothetical protein n=1 Tax=Haloferula sp. TaxID=2497595 RepID=UPI00329A9CC2